LYQAARIFAQAAGGLDKPGAPRNGQLASARYRYEGQAVELIRQALGLHSASERPAFWHKYVERDGALNPIRANYGFVHLANEYSRARK
jgi:hypothetical protein